MNTVNTFIAGDTPIFTDEIPTAPKNVPQVSGVPVVVVNSTDSFPKSNTPVKNISIEESTDGSSNTPVNSDSSSNSDTNNGNSNSGNVNSGNVSSSRITLTKLKPYLIVAALVGGAIVIGKLLKKQA